MNLSDMSVSELRTLQAKISQEIKRRQDDELLEAKKKIQAIAQSVGLDRQRAEAILASDEFANAVREEEQRWLSRGVNSVPTVVFNGQYAVTGGQPVETFVGAIRQIMNEAKGGTVS